jgi:hypothetical protein
MNSGTGDSQNIQVQRSNNHCHLYLEYNQQIVINYYRSEACRREMYLTDGLAGARHVDKDDELLKLNEPIRYAVIIRLPNQRAVFFNDK